MRIVVDTNILLAVALEEPEKADIVRLTRGADAAAPEILPYEIGNALSAMLKRARIDASEAAAALDVAFQIPLRLCPVDIGRALEIAAEYGLYAYDAYFLQRPLELGCPILTLDRQMRRVAERLGIQNVE